MINLAAERKRRLLCGVRKCRMLFWVASPFLLIASTLSGQETSSIPLRRAAQNPPSTIGLEIGERIPDFTARDQDGNFQDFSSVRGPNGAVIYFYRSAAWCIYCRAQLVQTEASKEALRQNGLGIVGISYDSTEVLKKFANDKKISFPLLSDPESQIIRDFLILDSSVLPGTPAYGVPYHGSYVINEEGVIVAKLFDTEATLGHSTGVVVAKLFDSPLNTHEKVVKHDRLTLSYYASSNFVSAGDEVELTIDVLLNDTLHVYAPDGGEHIPVEWRLEGSSAIAAHPVEFPPATTLILESTKDSAAVYTGRFQLSRKITINPGDLKTIRAVDAQGNVIVKGTFSFQACDDKICYLPTSIPLKWTLGESHLGMQHRAHQHSNQVAQ